MLFATARAAPQSDGGNNARVVLLQHATPIGNGICKYHNGEPTAATAARKKNDCSKENHDEKSSAPCGCRLLRMYRTNRNAATGECLLEVNSRSYMNGFCNIILERDGSFNIGADSNLRSKYFAYVLIDTEDGVARGYWNGQKGAVTHTKNWVLLFVRELAGSTAKRRFVLGGFWHAQMTALTARLLL